jgi:hypothetical protein
MLFVFALLTSELVAIIASAPVDLTLRLPGAAAPHCYGPEIVTGGEDGRS